MFCVLEETQVTKEMQGGEEFTCRGGGGALLVGLLRWRCCGGDRWLCRGSRTVTPGSGSTVSSGGERGYCSSLLLCFLAWRRRCLAGRTASLAVLLLRPVAVSWLTDGTPSSGATVSSGGERGYCSSLLLCFLSSSFVFQWFPFILSVCFLISYPISSFSFLSLCFGSSLSILSVLSFSVRFFPLFGLFSPLFGSFSPLTLTVPLFYLS